ncbi:uncharacterized protein [Amphiura filiformis]|uniref:uncharacterized protein n=1 Tax=Amphiura filiformis TaxID=82378 RepID=UPI003B2143D2
MTQTMWRLIRKTLKVEVGHDVFMTEGQLKQEIRNMEFEYECGTFTSSSGDEIQFVRVANIEEVVKKTVNDLHSAGLLKLLENVPQDTLWLHISADKGGKSTKLILQVINVGEGSRHSIKQCKLLAFFEGKDNRQNIEEVFGPILQQLNEMCSKIGELKLQRLTSPNCHQSGNLLQTLYKNEKNEVLTKLLLPVLLLFQSDDLNFTPLQPLNVKNDKVSSECQHCKKNMTSPGPKKKRRLCARRRRSIRKQEKTPHHEQDGTDGASQHGTREKPTEFDVECVPSAAITEPSDLIFTKGRLTVGGDWEWVAKFLGVSGPNGKYFCNSCLAVTTDMPKSVPHAMHIFPKYQDKTQGRSKVLPDDSDFLRTFDACHVKYEEYVAAGENKKHAQKFNNCIHPPLIRGPEFTVDTISTSPLHISLGLGLQVLNIVENTAIALDQEVKEAHGDYSPFETVFNHEKVILKKCQNLNNKIEGIQEKISVAKKNKIDIIKERAKFFKKNSNGSYTYGSDLAKGVRDQFEKLGKTIKDHEADIAKTKQTLKKQEKELQATTAELDRIKGPFKTKFDEVLDSLSLKRAVYHSGCLIGKKKKKLASYHNVHKFASIFKVTEIDTPNGAKKFSSDSLRVKMITLLTKFGQCYELYNKNSLCT